MNPFLSLGFCESAIPLRYTPPMKRRALFLPVLALIPVGCVSQNERNTIGNNLPIEAIAEPAHELAAWDAGRPEAMADDAPSLTGVDRSDWNTTTYLVPVDGVGHRPIYRSDHQLLRYTARQRMEFPTAESALELDGQPQAPIHAEEVAETLSQPLIAFGEAVLIVPRLIVEPQTRIDRSPLNSPQRMPGTPHARPLTGAVSQVPAPAVTPVAAPQTLSTPPLVDVSTPSGSSATPYREVPPSGLPDSAPPATGGSGGDR